MPRDGSKNLVSFATRTTNEVQEIARKGGIASGEARRKRKTFKEQMLFMLENDPNLQNDIMNALFTRAKKTGEKNGNAANRAFELIRETIGEAPVEEKKLNISHEVEDLTPLANMLGMNINGNSENAEN